MEPAEVSQLLIMASQRLAAAGCETPGLDAEVLLAYTLGRERSWLFMYPHYVLQPDELARFNELLSRRERREPVAYLVGHKEFFGLEFLVNRHVLIPRPETELLVETVLALYPANASLEIVDVGTGSGCIAVTLAKYLPRSVVVAGDTSAEALALARQNAVHHQVAGRVAFFLGNLLQPIDHPVDVIVSNPPYVSRLELSQTAPEVQLYEPRLALDGGGDGLAIIRQLLSQVDKKLKPGGALLLEIGSNQGLPVHQLARRYFVNAEVELKKDLAGLDRLLVVRLN